MKKINFFHSWELGVGSIPHKTRESSTPVISHGHLGGTYYESGYCCGWIESDYEC